MGKRTPIILSFGKENFESLVIRHGQFIRWRIAAKCPCSNKHTTQPDPQCPYCGGVGFRYSYQPEMTVTEEIMADGSNILEVSEEYSGSGLETVCDFYGVKYQAIKKGKYVILLDTVPTKGTFFTVAMNQKTVKSLKEAYCENAQGGYYRVEGIQSRREGIEGIYYTAPADIVKIGKITDADGLEYEAMELRTDLFRIVPHTETIIDNGNEIIQEIPIAEPLHVEDVEYVPPFIFALLSQNLSKEDSEILIEAKGDAVLTFPYSCDVSDGDILTALTGTHTQKEVVKRIEDADDTIGAYFVTEIVSCIGNDREYRAGVDFILIGTNYLRWICGDAPEPGEAYSITYRTCPTYKVVKSIPQIRTSENQRLPKKAIVQFFGTYGEHRRANQQ